MDHISPTNDLAFKKVLASEENKDILEGFIYDFFGINPKQIIIKNPYSIEDYKEILKGNEVAVLRQTLTDVSASFVDSEFIVELQVKKTNFFDERALYYPLDRYCQNYNIQDQLLKEKDGTVNRYSSLKPVYAMNILGYPHFEEDDDALRIFQMYDPERKKKYKKDLIKVGFFELSKTNVETKNQRYWQAYYKTGEVPAGAPAYIKKAVNIINFANLGKEEQRMAMDLEKARAIYDASLMYSRQEGREEGRIEGSDLKAREIIIEMKKEKLSDELIAKISKYPLDFIRSIQV